MSSPKLTKKDLEAKIAELEEKLARLSSQLESRPQTTAPPPAPKPQTQAPPPKPQTTPQPSAPARGSLPAGFKPQTQAPPPAPKPQTQAPPPAPKPQEAEQLAIWEQWRNAPMSDFHTYRAKVTGYSPAPNKYYASKRLGHVKVDVPTSDWNLQKAKVTGYTQPSNKYFATREKLAYHPRDKYFAGYGLKAGTALTTTAPPKLQTTPPPAP
ncbi:MAG TPA: trans-sialidase, partial [Candidatus Nitrosotenuis sp.]|nr:trans-sialidase [Candidatus Nitrosotenuis sp.]